MCGRYVRRSDKQRIAEAFKLGKLPPDFVLPPDFNVAHAAEEMTAWKVGKNVGNVRCNSPELLEPCADETGSLFD
jgi:putative SOS response-associated peptidase YedK